MPRKRLDVLLVERGLAESRARAQEAIAAGGVRVGGRLAAKASDQVLEDCVLELAPPHPWVSRAGLKLDHGLTCFGVDPAGRVCLDVGASTGGFSQVLLARGAAKVFAVDVGRDQLHAKLRSDPRLINHEGVDARALTRLELPEAPDLVVCDVSFIGLEKALPRPLELAADRADLIALIKPQFEAGPGKRGKSGNLEDEHARRVAEETAERLDGLEGFRLIAMITSPVRGGDGAREFLLHGKRG